MKWRQVIKSTDCKFGQIKELSLQRNNPNHIYELWSLQLHKVYKQFGITLHHVCLTLFHGLTSCPYDTLPFQASTAKKLSLTDSDESKNYIDTPKLKHNFGQFVLKKTLKINKLLQLLTYSKTEISFHLVLNCQTFCC